ncbi:MAG: hypothetical protein A3F72_10715 [Bacteroidetes bacterium RIFCSPLOWO2_12_FULL_35_15]|nr:MAG: hypothetical protein A3F72_10715 [Bacteroidetes bacterium RIFCSPLOWO2_12_FULL_35_15]
MSDLSKIIENSVNREGELNEPVSIQKNEENSQKSIDISDFSFSDLVDISDLQPLVNHYSELAGCVIGILDVDNTLLASAGWQKICSYFHRLHPEERIRCTECDNFIKQNLNTENPTAYRCKNGLWDVIHPIYIGGKHLANIFFGQFFFDDEAIDISHFESQAAEYGFDKTEYIKAVQEVPVFSSKKVDTLKHFNAALAHIITKKGYTNLLLKKEKIEELKIVNKQLIESELKFRKLFEQAGVGVAQVGASTGGFLKINKKFADMLGYTIDEMLQLTFQELTHPDDLKENLHHQELLLQKKITEYSTEKRYFRKDGTIIWVMITVSPMWELEDGKEYHILIVQDITERKKIEQTLTENEAKFKELNSTKDKFFSIIAHDLKNPFTVLKGASELLSIYLEKNDLPKSKAKAEMISNASIHGYALLENLLVWAKSQTGGILFEPQKINLKNRVGESIKEVEDNARVKNIIIINEIPGNLILEVDENLLSVVFRNLITNAIKFTHHGGKIKITATTEKHLVEIAVIDTGIGIPKEHQYKLFRLDTNFSRTGTANEKSTSLGLLLCKEFIEKHKGEIWVESEENKGSEFRFTLPYIQNGSVS